MATLKEWIKKELNTLEKSDSGKLSDWLKAARKSRDEVRKQNLVSEQNESEIPSHIKDFVPFSLPKDLSQEEALKWSEQTVSSLMGNYRKNKIPLWLAYPLVVIVSTISLMASLVTAAGVITQKSIIQPLSRAIRPALLGPETLVKAQLRKLVSNEQVKKVLSSHGLSDPDIVVLQKMAGYVPGAQDIIMFAVREAYDSATVSKFGQDDNLDSIMEATRKDRENIGLSDDSFAKYWFSHWELPGVSQGFEAFHRKIISKEELNMLLKAKDITSFWRETLLKISYNLVPRVDIRRMHKMGIYKDSDLPALFEKIGYSPEDAQSLALFTIQYNKSPEAAEKTDKDLAKEKQKDLTKGDIISAFKDDYITEGTAKSSLLKIGFDQSEVDMLVNREVYNKDIKYTEALIDTYRDLYIKGLADRPTIETELKTVSLLPEKITALFNLWDLMKYSKSDIPSRADALRWFKKKMIDEDTTRGILSALGTQPDFIDLYIKENV